MKASIEQIAKGLEKNTFGLTKSEIIADATSRYAKQLEKIKKLDFLVIDSENENSIEYHQEIPVI